MPKLALRRCAGRWHKAAGDQPTSHILKPSVSLYPGQATGEHLGLATARRLGIDANDAHGKNHALLHLPGGACRLAPLYDVASWLPHTDVPARHVHLATALGGGYDVGVGARTDDWRAMAHEIGADPEWAVAEVMRIAREAPAHLLAEIDQLPPAVRSSGAPTRLLNAVARRSVDIVDATLG